MQKNSHDCERRGLSARALAALVAIALAGPALAAGSSTAPAQAPSAPTVASAKKQTSTVPSSQQIDINSASREKLKTLPGIGNAEADKIVAGRPYHSKADLVIRNILPESSYAAIKYRVVAIPPGKTSSKK